jgi:hypothetical protein
MTGRNPCEQIRAGGVGLTLLMTGPPCPSSRPRSAAGLGRICRALDSGFYFRF